MTGIECALSGRVGQEPVCKESKAGKPWLALSVAVGEGDDVQWLQVAVFGSRLHGTAADTRGSQMRANLKLVKPAPTPKWDSTAEAVPVTRTLGRGKI